MHSFLFNWSSLIIKCLAIKVRALRHCRHFYPKQVLLTTIFLFIAYGAQSYPWDMCGSDMISQVAGTFIA